LSDVIKDFHKEKYERESKVLMGRLFDIDHYFRLDGFLLDRYIETLITVLGHKEAESLPRGRPYYIDMCGYSKEIADFLGNRNYLYLKPSMYYALIVSPEQAGAGTSYMPFSFLKDALTSAYKRYDELLKVLTKDSVAVLQMKLNIRNLEDVNQIVSLKSLNMKIDTIEGRVSDITKMKKMIDLLGDNDNILSDSYVEDMMTAAKKVGNIKNNIGRLNTEDIYQAINSFFVEYPVPAMMLFDAENEKSLFFHGMSDLELDSRSEGVFGVLIDKTSVLENLEKLNFIDYHMNAAFIGEKIEEIENLELIERGHDINMMSNFELERVRSGLVGDLPPVVEELAELKNKIEKQKKLLKSTVKGLSEGTKYMLAFAKAEFPIVNKLLCLFDRNNYLRRYYAENYDLLNELEKMPVIRKYYVLKKLSTQIKRSGY